MALYGVHTERDGPEGYTLDAQGHGIGPLIVVREDGSTSRVQANLVENWIYHQGRWMLRAGATPQRGDLVRTRFPGEEWPPQD